MCAGNYVEAAVNRPYCGLGFHAALTHRYLAWLTSEPHLTVKTLDTDILKTIDTHNVKVLNDSQKTAKLRNPWPNASSEINDLALAQLFGTSSSQTPERIQKLDPSPFCLSPATCRIQSRLKCRIQS